MLKHSLMPALLAGAIACAAPTQAAAALLYKSYSFGKGAGGILISKSETNPQLVTIFESGCNFLGYFGGLAGTYTIDPGSKAYLFTGSFPDGSQTAIYSFLIDEKQRAWAEYKQDTGAAQPFQLIASGTLTPGMPCK